MKTARLTAMSANWAGTSQEHSLRDAFIFFVRPTAHITGPRVEHWQNNKKLDRAAPVDVIVRRRSIQLEVYSQSFFNISSSILYP